MNSNPPWFEDSESEDENWMSESIQKYEHLYNYKMDHPVKILKVNDDSMLIVTEKAHSKFEIAIYLLPEKVHRSPPLDKSKEGLIKNRELMLKHGLQIESEILDADFIRDCNNGIQVAVRIPDGLEIFKPDEKSDLLVKCDSVEIQGFQTKMKCWRNERILLFGRNSFMNLNVRTLETIDCYDEKKDILDVTEIFERHYIVVNPKQIQIFTLDKEKDDIKSISLNRYLKRACSITSVRQNHTDPLKFTLFGIDENDQLVFGQYTNHETHSCLDMTPIPEFQNCDDIQSCNKILGDCLMVTSLNKIYLLQTENNKSWLEPKFFTHTCSSKASSITAFTASWKNLSHKPTTDGLLKIVPIIMCADNKKSVDIFQKSQTEGIQV